MTQAALHAYILATRGSRKRILRRMATEGRAPVCVLFYHRVADHHPNNWTISTNSFVEHMKWLQQNADMVSLPEAQRRLREGNERLAVSITFDDGYADNCEAAVPFLIKQNIPTTYFVSLDFVLTGRSFPHDRQAGIPLLPNTPKQLLSMADGGVEIGGHTRHHADLGATSNEQTLHDEVVASTDELAALVQRPVRYFAFPYGQPKNLSARAVAMARDAGLLGVVSAFGGYNVPNASVQSFYLRRIHGDPQFSRLKNWITLDPRKMKLVNDDLPIVAAAAMQHAESLAT